MSAVRWDFEGIKKERINTKKPEGIMTCLCDLLDEIYLYWLLKEEGSWKVKVMCSRETRTVLEFGELWKNNGLAISISESRITQSM